MEKRELTLTLTREEAEDIFDQFAKDYEYIDENLSSDPENEICKNDINIMRKLYKLGIDVKTWFRDFPSLKERMENKEDMVYVRLANSLPVRCPRKNVKELIKRDEATTSIYEYAPSITLSSGRTIVKGGDDWCGAFILFDCVGTDDLNIECPYIKNADELNDNYEPGDVIPDYEVILGL